MGSCKLPVCSLLLKSIFLIYFKENKKEGDKVGWKKKQELVLVFVLHHWIFARVGPLPCKSNEKIISSSEHMRKKSGSAVGRVKTPVGIML